jgi:aspartate/methionine/tyrosine aminotransferase
VDLREADGWRLDPDEVRAALRPNTRLILVNEPHNPTGSLSDRATFDRLVELAAESGARLIVDEVYRFLEFDPADRLPAGADALATGVSIGVMSKSFALAGLRIGWIATRDRALLERSGRVQGLHHDLQLRPRRSARADRPAGSRPRPGAQPGDR